jgi:hypothetical protein
MIGKFLLTAATFAVVFAAVYQGALAVLRAYDLGKVSLRVRRH